MRNTKLIRNLENQINELEIRKAELDAKKAELEVKLNEAETLIYSDMADFRNNFIRDFVEKNSEDLTDFDDYTCLETTDYLDDDNLLYVIGYYKNVEEVTSEELNFIAWQANIVDDPDDLVIVEQPEYDWLEFYENIIIGDKEYHQTKIRFVTNQSYRIVEEEECEECEECED